MNKPELTFVSTDVEELESTARAIIEESLGRSIAAADPITLLIKSLLAIIVQQRALLNWTAKQNLLAYSTGQYLDALGQLVGVERLPATSARTTLEVTLSTARGVATTIRQGSRVTADNQTFFALDADLIFLSGETVKTATATCLNVGEVGNGFSPGELNQIVDPQPFLLSMTNTTTSAGGSDVEDDESLRERIFIAPESFSCAGSRQAYVARVKEVSALIDDVVVTSPEPGRVDIFLLMTNGQLPTSEIILAVTEHLNDKLIRPLTDIVSVKSPTPISYSINVDCFISNDDRGQAAQIIRQANQAAEDFKTWQSAKIGRDVNPGKLISQLMGAGVKRVAVNAPTFTRLDEFSVARCQATSLRFNYEDE